MTRISLMRRRMILPYVGNQHELILFGHVLNADDTAGFVRRLHRDDAFAAARLQAILVHRGALAVAAFGNGQNIEAKAENFHAHDLIPRVEPHADDPEGSAARRTHLLFFETDRLPFCRRQE